MTSRVRRPDLVCLSHLRWRFVFQRPQHLMVRFARARRVFFVEEPVIDGVAPRLEVTHAEVTVVTPHLPSGLRCAEALRETVRLLHSYFHESDVEQPTVWAYTAMMWPLIKDMPVSAVIYDCMDELSGFAGAPADLQAKERELMARADVMFTGGHSLFESKRRLHPNVHPFPSSVDVAHFKRARSRQAAPSDQQAIPRPRIGFCGVIDERMDVELVRDVAAAHPEWHFVMLGPVVKIDEAALPRAANLHYLGMKSYADLPSYLSGWDVAILPFARNAATRFISPTKTPEYLAAGCPVVSTSIRDVVRPYGETGLVAIADSPREFGDAIARCLAPGGRDALAAADRLLATQSWDRTWEAMNALVCAAERGDATKRARPFAAAAAAAAL